MKRFKLIIMLLLLSTALLTAQNRSGVVKDDKGEPLPGVSVRIEDKNVGTVTDVDGKFSISAENSDKLTFSFVGMTNKMVTVGTGNDLGTITMSGDVEQLEDVVVVGYGTQRRENLTGAVSSVSAKDLDVIPTANVAARLQGRVSGVTVRTDNAPGGDVSIRIRGIGTINNNDPLIIIDGITSDIEGLSQINPDNIESLTVLKDAASTAIYGVRAANGVVLVKTKGGKKGKFKISVSARYGVSHITNKLGLLNTKEYGELLWLEAKNAYDLGLSTTFEPGNEQYGKDPAGPKIPDYIIPSGAMEGDAGTDEASYDPATNRITRANKEGTDWYDVIYRAGIVQNYNVSASGGSEIATFLLSLGYYRNDGALKHTYYERYSSRANITAYLRKWLTLGTNLGLTYSSQNNRGGNADDHPIAYVHRMQPIVPVYDIKGNFAGTKAKATGNGENPLSILVRNKDNYRPTLRIYSASHLTLTPIKGLSIRTLFGANIRQRTNKDRDLANPEFSEGQNFDALTRDYNGRLVWNWTNTVDYSREIGKHDASILLGTEAVSSWAEWFGARRTNFFSKDINYMVLDAGEQNQTNWGSFTEGRTYSLFGRLNYNFDGKYLFEGVIRRDASSRFSKDVRVGAFPAAAVAWRVSKESFMGWSDGFLDNLKIRLGWGQNGNDQVNAENAFNSYQSSLDFSSYPITGAQSATTPGFRQNRIGNPDAKWETTTTWNLGIDAILLKNKLDFSVELYDRTTTDMLYPATIPSYILGDATAPDINVGEMNNKGIDIALAYYGKIGSDWKYDVSLNLSAYKNRVVKLNDAQKQPFIPGNSLRQFVYARTEPGQAISSFYGYKVDPNDQFFTSADDVKNHPKYNPDANGNDSYSKPGKLKYVDVNGDGKITPDDRTYIGSPHPDFTYGLNLSISYKNIDLSMFFSGTQGNDVINYVRRWTDFNNFQGNRSKARLHESWTPERQKNGSKISLPIALANDEIMQRPSSFFLEDGSYLRLKNIQIGYSLPKGLISRWKIASLRVYTQATNLFTITGYSGLDPEIRGENDRDLGVDAGIYPTARQYIVGLTMSL